VKTVTLANVANNQLKNAGRGRRKLTCKLRLAGQDVQLRSSFMRSHQPPSSGSCRKNPTSGVTTARLPQGRPDVMLSAKVDSASSPE